MKRAVAYCRYSSDMQREESIEAQLRAIRDYCNSHDFALVSTYIDRAISGTSADKRPEFLRMIKDSEEQKFDAVIVHKLDRFARNRYDSAFYKNILKRSRVKLISVLENLTDDPESVILESVLEGLGEYYSLNLAREIRKGLQENALAAKFAGGVPPLGYMVDPETQRLVINEHEAEAVRLLFRMYLEGYGYGDIINTLNSKGYRTRRGLPFAKNSLYALLRNEKYVGNYTYVRDVSKNPTGRYQRFGGDYDPDYMIKIPGAIPPIISEEDFNKVQDKMKERRHKAAKFSAKQEYLLSGKIYCSECGSPFAGNSRRPRADHPLYVSYKCTRRNERNKTCRNPEINRDKLESIVLDRLSNVLFNPEVIPDLIERYNTYISEKNSGAKERVSRLSKELRDVERKISNAVDLMIETGSASLKKKLRELEEQQEALKFSLLEAEASMACLTYSEEQITELFLKAKQQLKEGTLSVRRQIIDQYVNRVVVYPDKIEVHLNVFPEYTVTETVERG